MENLQLNIDNVFDFVSKDKVWALSQEAEKYNDALTDKTGKGNDFLGWVNLPSSITPDFISDVKNTAKELSEKIDVLVVIGIGGSYLGAKSIIEALSNSFAMLKESDEPLVLFAGQNIGEDYLMELRKALNSKSWAITVISKSGTTTEPAIAFRILKQDLEMNYGKDEARNRIIAITDKERGALKELAVKEGYKTYIIPDDVGGRYSVLTPVGLIPIAVAGFDIEKFVQGAIDYEKLTAKGTKFDDNPAAIYAAVRNVLYQANKTTEILVNYNPKLHYLAEWWKQLYGESEGKEGKGIFPASVDFSTDLHSLGQYIQEGIRNIFETIISVKTSENELRIPEDKANLDKLNYLAGKRIDEVNKMAELGTLLAHIDGGVPNIKLEIPEISEYYLGQLVYFFEKACGISGYLLGVNPFDQPGVEAYKKNMFALLGKPGFEEETKKIQERIK